jgi:hypothetical protein
LISLPLTRAPKLVSFRVKGIILTLNLSSFIEFTVRLTPFIETEPFSAINLSSFFGGFISIIQHWLLILISEIFPMPSIWPVTK